MTQFFDENVEYKQLSEIEHVLLRPDMYMGEKHSATINTYTYDIANEQVLYEKVCYNCGIYKLFDEIFTNAVDNVERHANVKNIEVEISDTTISVKNDGKNTLKIVKCPPPNDDIYIPELVFTRLRSGSNFDDTKKRTYGGRNGIGSKLAVIFSKEFIIEIVNSGTKYVQVVNDNCNKINQPYITKVKSNDYVKITFQPDFSKFDCDCISEDTKRVLYKRVHDISHLNLNLTINSVELPKYKWDDYVRSYPGIGTFISFVEPTTNWKVAIASANKGSQVSTVNYVKTFQGGNHVDYILKQVMEYINANVKSLSAKTKPTKPTKGTKASKKPKEDNKKSDYSITEIKAHTMVVLSSIVENPEFVDQAKTKLQTTEKKIREINPCILPDKLLKQFVKETDIIDQLESKTRGELIKGLRKNVNHIAKYIKANNANSKNGHKCTLFICEGDSAKTMCITGMNIIGYDYFGVYPLRGKLLNVRKCDLDKFVANREIQDLISIIGLDLEKEYTTTKGLNYGKIVCMKDADSDGADIMGLIMNFFEQKFKSLIQLPGFFNEFITPMIQVVNKKETFDFYNEVEYKKFLEEHGAKLAKYSVRFIKGLASNTKDDINKYFKKYNDYLIEVLFQNNYIESLDKAFNEKRANDRKKWMTTITPDTHLPRIPHTPIQIDDFIDKELVLYSMDACVRAIPSLIDGLKPVQRKILYTMCNETSLHRLSEIKVYQLCGNVAQFANYHHGEASLNGAIIKMAQSYPGSNNLPLIVNNSDGFGTRQENGNDCGQPRYISLKTKIPLARIIFPAVDDNVLEYKIEDNDRVEPYYYIPIIPMVLVNGAVGIGMGWSTIIPLHSISDIIEFVKGIINGEEDLPLIRTWYKDYDGDIAIGSGCYIHTGKFEINASAGIVRVTEIPIDISISSFRDIIVKVLMLEEGEGITVTTDSGTKTTKFNKTGYHIKNFKTFPTRNVNHIDMELEFDKGDLTDTEKVIKVLHLRSTIPTTNMVAFDANHKIKQYENIIDMIVEWYDVRYECYVKRKAFLIKQLEDAIFMLKNKVRFVKENIEETLAYKNKSDEETNRILEEHNYDRIKDSYEYLLSMQVRSFTKKKYDELTKELNKSMEELEKLKLTTVEMMWLNDIAKLENALTEDDITH